MTTKGRDYAPFLIKAVMSKVCGFNETIFSISLIQGGGEDLGVIKITMAIKDR